MQRIKEIIAWCKINRRDSISVWHLFPPGPNWFWGAVYNSRVFKLEKELYESQLDFYYLTSPKILQEKMSFLTSDKYQHMGISKIYLDYYDFISSQKKISKKIIYEEKKNKK